MSDFFDLVADRRCVSCFRLQLAFGLRFCRARPRLDGLRFWRSKLNYSVLDFSLCSESSLNVYLRFVVESNLARSTIAMAPSGSVFSLLSSTFLYMGLNLMNSFTVLRIDSCCSRCSSFAASDASLNVCRTT
jgi:hypothetical protein